MDMLEAADAGASPSRSLEPEKRTSNKCDDDKAEEGFVQNAALHLSGYQLYLTVLAVSLAGFLYSLDITIITTVSFQIRYLPSEI